LKLTLISKTFLFPYGMDGKSNSLGLYHTYFIMFNLQTIRIPEEIPEVMVCFRQKISRPPLVLIVDDNDDSRLMLKCLLDIWNYRSVEAIDGWEALRRTEETKPDLILMDVKLPDIDGIEATRLIRAMQDVGGVPIIFISASAEKSFQTAGIAAGGNEYIAKPLDFEQLKNTLEKYIAIPI
jgi:CheY-like chemotaxis protein